MTPYKNFYTLRAKEKKMAENSKIYLNKAQLKAEVDRCLNCKTQPCMQACPTHCNPREFIEYTKNGEGAKAAASIIRDNILGQTCGLVCPDKFCMKACLRAKLDFAINIPKVQATILENYRQNEREYQDVKENGLKIAVIGAGPAGLAAAAKLAEGGCRVDIFESQNCIGGALNLIPSTRLPKDVVQKDWAYVFNRKLVTLNLNTEIKDVKSLSGKYDWVVVAKGEPNVSALGIEGEEYALSYMEYLRHPEKYVTDGKVAVVGGGNVAVDCAFTAKMQGAREVEMFVRRRTSNMRISRAEYMELVDNNIDVTSMTSPEKIEKSGDLLDLYVHKNEFVNDKLTPMPDTTFKLGRFSLIIKAIGSRADSFNEEENIMYIGDCKHGASTVVEAVASGKQAAEQILSTI